MKTFLVFIILLFSLELHAQGWSEFNSSFGLSDSLTNSTEIRIYQGPGITNYSSLIRMYDDGYSNWTVELFEYWAKVDGVAEFRTSKKLLTSKSEMSFVFLNLKRSFIFDLPSRTDIKWKLLDRGEIYKIEKKQIGSKIEEYDLINKVKMPLDGTVFYFQAKSPRKYNEFNFGNPENYAVLYPEIDEPKYVCEILDIIRDEFDIWKK